MAMGCASTFSSLASNADAAAAAAGLASLHVMPLHLVLAVEC